MCKALLCKTSRSEHCRDGFVSDFDKCVQPYESPDSIHTSGDIGGTIQESVDISIGVWALGRGIDGFH